MTSSICYSVNVWFHAMILHPYQEGSRRIRRACSKKDPYRFDHPPLMLKDRVISLVAGLLLLLPFINTIIWVWMRTVGQPDVLSDPLPLSNEQTDPLPQLRHG
ncbi:MAG: hypothetical protein KGJ02_07475 [Verrucomicrobiota bacterium]|nr:hypothetical protein [Verrucomicrobiota bacterium]